MVANRSSGLSLSVSKAASVSSSPMKRSTDSASAARQSSSSATAVMFLRGRRSKKRAGPGSLEQFAGAGDQAVGDAAGVDRQPTGGDGLAQLGHARQVDVGRAVLQGGQLQRRRAQRHLGAAG